MVLETSRSSAAPKYIPPFKTRFTVGVLKCVKPASVCYKHLWYLKTASIPIQSDQHWINTLPYKHAMVANEHDIVRKLWPLSYNTFSKSQSYGRKAKMLHFYIASCTGKNKTTVLLTVWCAFLDWGFMRILLFILWQYLIQKSYKMMLVASNSYIGHICRRFVDAWYGSFNLFIFKAQTFRVSLYIML